jgi:hypothetical protein
VLREFDAAAIDQRRYAYEAAVIHATLGDIDAAFERLRGAVEERSGWIPYLGVDPRLDPLRGDSRYLELERLMGLEPPPLIEQQPNKVSATTGGGDRPGRRR